MLYAKKMKGQMNIVVNLMIGLFIFGVIGAALLLANNSLSTGLSSDTDAQEAIANVTLGVKAATSQTETAGTVLGVVLILTFIAVLIGAVFLFATRRGRQ